MDEYVEIYDTMSGNYSIYDEIDWDELVDRPTQNRVNWLLQTMYGNLETLSDLIDDNAPQTQLKQVSDTIVDANNELADIYERHTRGWTGSLFSMFK